MKPQQRFAHVPTLDGLRGLSVIGPLLFHARRSALPGGFLTIDVFFLLSSYLIVSIALNEWDRTNRIDVVAYAGRRARRLLPALFVCTLVLSVYIAIVADTRVPRWTGGIVSSLAYVANWHEIFAKVSYFEQFSDPSPVYHTWSLSIEEQFYIVVPLLLIALLKWPRRGKPALGALGVSAAVASAAWMAHLYQGGDPSRVYYGTDTRAQGLLVGVVLAVAVHLWGPVRTAWGRRLAIAGAYAGVAYLLYAVRNQSQSTTWLFERGGFLVVAGAAALVVLGASQPSRGPLHRVLGAPPTRGLGRITYGVYLYHWPLFLLVITPERLAASPWWTVAALALTIAVATGAYFAFERPVMQRRLPGRSERARPIVLGAAGLALVGLVAVALVVANVRQPDDAAAGPRPIPTVPVTQPPPQTGATGTGTTTVPARAPRVLVIGDSLMLEIGITLERYGDTHPDEVVAYTHAHLGCPIVRGGDARSAEGGVERVDPDCNQWADPATEAQVLAGRLSYPTVVERFVPEVVLGLATPWDVTDRRFPAEGNVWQHVGEPAFDAKVVAEYRLATQLLAAKGAKVLWLLGPHLNRPVVPQNDPVRIDRLNELVRQAIAGIPGADVVDYPAWLGPVGSAREKRLRADGVHLSQAGLDEITPWLLDEVIPAALR